MKRFWFFNLPQSPHQHIFSIFLTAFVIIETSLSENCSDIQIAQLCINSSIIGMNTTLKPLSSLNCKKLQVNQFSSMGWPFITTILFITFNNRREKNNPIILHLIIMLSTFLQLTDIMFYLNFIGEIGYIQLNTHISIFIVKLIQLICITKDFFTLRTHPFSKLDQQLVVKQYQKWICDNKIILLAEKYRLLEMETLVFKSSIQEQVEIQTETISMQQQKFNTFLEFLKQNTQKLHFEKENLCIVLKDKAQHIKYSVQLSELQLSQISEKYFAIKYDIILNHESHKKTKFNQNFVSSLSHKLKTPLSSALVHLSALLKDESIIESIKSNHLIPAYLNCQLQLYSVQDIMDYLNQNYQKLEPRAQPIDLIKVVQNALKLVEYSCKQKQIQLKFTVNQQEKEEYDPVLFMTDENKLSRILLNIINNSYRYTSQNGYISIDLNTNVNNQAHFKIKDNGVGITKQKQIQLNQLLSNKINLFKTQKDIYIGLGLQVSNQLVKILNNTQTPISFKVNKFTVFKFQIDSLHDLQSASLFQSQRNIESYRSARCISVVSGAKSQSLYSQINRQISNMDDEIKFSIDDIEFEPTQQKLLVMRCQSQIRKNSQIESGKPLIVNTLYPQITKQSSMGLINQSDFDQDYILIVDDEPFNHVSISLILKQINITQIKSAYNGQECLDFIRVNQDKIRLVLMDVDMPVMNGIQATKRIIDQQKLFIWKQFPIIGFTAHQDMKTQQQCLQAGMLIVLQKPVLSKSLYDVIKLVEDSDALENLKRHSSQIL
ncbi:hypothetical protein pb186bvf_004129 [Paramecium bursaria]